MKNKTFSKYSTLTLTICLLISLTSFSTVALGADKQFVALKDGTVQDTKTGLNWAAKDNGANIIWSQAVAYCKSYSAGKHNDWRMPTATELATLYGSRPKVKGKDYANHIDVITKTITITAPYIWTGEKRTDNKAITFGFNYGTIKRLYRADGTNRRVLPVR